MAKTEFQRRFKVNDEFYSGQQIRDAVRECFPWDGEKHQGLARITITQGTQGGSPIHSNQPLNLEELIPNIGKFPRRGTFGVIEGVPLEPKPTAATYFEATELGYVCDEMEIQGIELSIGDERLLS